VGCPLHLQFSGEMLVVQVHSLNPPPLQQACYWAALVACVSCQQQRSLLHGFLAAQWSQAANAAAQWSQAAVSKPTHRLPKINPTIWIQN
jgi:hypothetical protein